MYYVLTTMTLRRIRSIVTNAHVELLDKYWYPRKVSYVHIHLCLRHTTIEAHSHVSAPNHHIGARSYIV